MVLVSLLGVSIETAVDWLARACPGDRLSSPLLAGDGGE